MVKYLTITFIFSKRRPKMTSNTCILPPLVQKEYSETKEEYINRRKNDFNTNIKNKYVIYNGKPMYLVYHDIEGDACFNKFAIGSEKYHTKADGIIGEYDILRVQRLEWIFSILNNLKHCENKCKALYRVPDKNYKDRFDLYCLTNNYKIVIPIKDTEGEYLVITAFYMRST